MSNTKKHEPQWSVCQVEPKVHKILHRPDNSKSHITSSDNSISRAMPADDKARMPKKIPSEIHMLPKNMPSQKQNWQLLQKETSENNHNTAPAGIPSQQPKIAKKAPFISKKKLPLLVGLASATAFIVIAAIALLVTSLNVRYSISINGQTGIYLSNEEEAQAVLDGLTAYYSSLASANSISVSAVTYEENVAVVKTKAASSEIKNKDEALQDLINGQPQTLEYIAAEGETIQEIAQKHEITVESIIAENEGLTEESQLEEGAAVKLVVVQPYLHVIVEGVSETTEEIDFTTEKKEDSNLALNTTKVQQEGENGSKDVTYALVLKNGVLVEKTVLEEVVIKEPVPEVVLEGTKPPQLAVASKSQSSTQTSNNQSSTNLSSDEKLQYIINRESKGNVYATNGKYKGLGQLQEQHYQAYVGMSYAETLQQSDPYAVQLEAMLGYINSRYGSVESAYNFWIKNGWY